ncbi:MAG: ATP-binding protein [Sphingobium sp.]
MQGRVSEGGPIRRRLARHWLWRLRREAEFGAIERAVELGVLDRHETATGGVFFKIGKAIVGWSIDRVRQLLGRGSALPTASRGRMSASEPSWEDAFNLDKDRALYVVDDSSGTAAQKPAPKRRRSKASLSEQDAVSDAAQTRVGADDPGTRHEPPAGTAAPRRRTRRLDRGALLRLIRSQAAASSATQVATMLMLADAIEQSGIAIIDVLAILRRPKPIIVVRGEAKGLEESFTDLLKSGFILPGTSRSMSGYELRSARDKRHGDGSRRVLIHFAARDTVDEKSEFVDRQVGLAIQHACPILVTADQDEFIPKVLVDAADLTINCGAVSVELIAETMRVVMMRDNVGAAAAYTADREVSALQSLLEGCEVLSLTDLALAIRSGMAPERCIGVLRSLIGRRTAEQDKPRPRSGSAKSSSGSTSSRSSSDTSTSRRGRVGSGSTVIEPEPFVSSEPDTAASSKATMPVRVETLTGYGLARDWALALKDDLVLWKKDALLWSQMSTRLLLAGPPGTGKTTFARALGNSLRLPVYATSVGTWLELSYLGDVLARMAAAFAEAEANAPCILFIDEVDGIGRRSHGKRGEHDDYWNSIVNRALELMDGAIKTEGVIVVGATNHPAAIDPALLRSGRLETRIDIPIPDVDALVGILRHHLGGEAESVLASATPFSLEKQKVVEGQSPSPFAPATGSASSNPPSAMQKKCRDGAEFTTRARAWSQLRWFQDILPRLLATLRPWVPRPDDTQAATSSRPSDRADRHHTARVTDDRG